MAVFNTAMAQAQRELKEAANLPAVADALIQSAQEELRCAQAIRSELLLSGKEALNGLDAPPYVHQPGPQEFTISGPQDFAAGFLADSGLLSSAPPVVSEPQRVPSPDPVVESSQAAPSVSDAISGPGSVAWESPRDAEAEAAPEPAPETPSHQIPEEVESRMGGGFEVSEPPAAPAPPEPPTIPQPTFEATRAAPPSDWFTQALTNGAPSTTPRLPTEVPEPAPPSAWFNLHGSTKRSHRKQMKLPCRRLHRRPHLLLHRQFRRSPMPNYWKRRLRQRLRPANRLAAPLPQWPRSLPGAWGFSRGWRTPGANRDRGGAATRHRSAGPTTGTPKHGH